jgi:hypothetical protein
LSPIKQSRELNPLDATLDSEPQKQAVEMRFDCALGNVQIPSDFRVVTPLEQQTDDLPFSWSHLIELFFHNHYTRPTPQTPQLAREPGPLGTSGFGPCVSFCIHAAKSRVEVLTKCENCRLRVFPVENCDYRDLTGRLRAGRHTGFAQT